MSVIRICQLTAKTGDGLIQVNVKMGARELWSEIDKVVRTPHEKGIWLTQPDGSEVWVQRCALEEIVFLSEAKLQIQMDPETQKIMQGLKAN